jgi:hypothetical protein
MDTDKTHSNKTQTTATAKTQGELKLDLCLLRKNPMHNYCVSVP